MGAGPCHHRSLRAHARPHRPLDFTCIVCHDCVVDSDTKRAPPSLTQTERDQLHLLPRSLFCSDSLRHFETLYPFFLGLQFPSFSSPPFPSFFFPLFFFPEKASPLRFFCLCFLGSFSLCRSPLFPSRGQEKGGAAAPLFSLSPCPRSFSRGSTLTRLC
jgi:hypothetical protein